MPSECTCILGLVSAAAMEDFPFQILIFNIYIPRYMTPLLHSCQGPPWKADTLLACAAHGRESSGDKTISHLLWSCLGRGGGTTCSVTQNKLTCYKTQDKTQKERLKVGPWLSCRWVIFAQHLSKLAHPQPRIEM